MAGLAAAVTDAWMGLTDTGGLSWTEGRIAGRRALAWAEAGATRAWAGRRSALPSSSSSSSSRSPLPLAWIGAGPEGRAVAVLVGPRAFLRLVPDGGGPSLSITGIFSPGSGEHAPGMLMMTRLRARESAASRHFSISSIPDRTPGRLTGRESTK